GTSVGTVQASDPDDDPLTYTITAGSTGNTFHINSSSGEITVSDNTLLDFESNPTFDLTISVDDGNSGTASATITINVNDIIENNSPIIADQTFSIDENSSNGTSVGTVQASDPDDDPLTYTITAGSTGNTFHINSSSGEITVSDNTLLDFESNPTFDLTISVDDGNSGTASATITINVNDIIENNSPIIADQTFSIDENSSNGTSVGTVQASDLDDDPLTYNITAGNIGNTFHINSSSGEITVSDNTLLDFETNPTFDLTISVDDGNSGTASATITINVIDIIENNSPIIADQTFSIDENSSNGTSVGTVQASDPDDDPLTYTINAGNTGNTFDINSSSGEITVSDNTLLDFESNPSFNLSISVDDGNSGTASATITINVIDIIENNSPIIADQTFSIDENSSNGTSVGTVQASDPDDDPLTYTITAGSTGNTFHINSSSGEITVSDNTLLDFETNPIFLLVVEVNDGELFAEAEISIELNNVDEPEVLGMKDRQGNEIKLYPNPVQNFIIVKWKNYQYAILSDLSGKELFKSNSSTINLKALKPNSYIIVLIGTSDERLKYRIIKK
ncbi:cadherin domain-containing protein, partial [Marivirga sp.]|uniref:cadherin repeat domain-containing protein n=1 Tax=Marivirga sp. TaxID=2018662 RepID=UPI003DA6CE66